MQDGLYERLYIVHETDALESGPSITISVDGAPRSMTVQEISQMSLKQFAFLWAVRAFDVYGFEFSALQATASTVLQQENSSSRYNTMHLHCQVLLHSNHLLLCNKSDRQVQCSDNSISAPFLCMRPVHRIPFSTTMGVIYEVPASSDIEI